LAGFRSRRGAAMVLDDSQKLTMIRIFGLTLLVAIAALVARQSIGQQRNVMRELTLGYAMRACVYRSLLDHMRSLTPPDAARKNLLKVCDAEIAAYRASGRKPDTIISDGMKLYGDAYVNLQMK
jgi:hypothetical protein